MLRRYKPERGFTLPELLVVVVIFGLFAAGASILIHPVEYGPARQQAERWTGVAQLTQALGRYIKDNGRLPEPLNSGDIALLGTDEDMVNLCSVLIPRYLKELPTDPAVVSEANSNCKKGGVMITGYAAQRVADNAFEVSAPLADDGHVLLRRQF